MIILLTIIITFFTIINLVSIIIVIFDCDIDSPEIIYNISKWILISEALLAVSGLIVLFSSAISHAIVCNVTKND